MFRLFLLLPCFFLFSIGAQAQWKRQIGLNLVPMAAKTIEVTTELSHHPAYGIQVHGGYTFATGMESIYQNKVYDGVRERKTSGVFGKVGGRVYWFSLGGESPRVNLFTGVAFIVSQYKQSAEKADLTSQVGDWNYELVEARGVLVAPSFSVGLTHRLTNRFNLDWGFQHAYPQKRTDFIGLPGRNYQPGIGNRQEFGFLKYTQGLLVLKYRL